MREDAKQTALVDDHHRVEVAEQIAAVLRAQHDRCDLLAPEHQQRMDDWLASLEDAPPEQ